MKKRTANAMVLSGLVTIFLVACPGSKAASTASDVAVKVADDTCHELVDAGVLPEWVELVCDTAAGPVRVLLPRQEWHSILLRKAGSVDAGPGK